MLCCHLLSLTANKAWRFELSRQLKVIICDVRACWCFRERCRMELCLGSSSGQEQFFCHHGCQRHLAAWESKGFVAHYWEQWEIYLREIFYFFPGSDFFVIGCEMGRKASRGVRSALYRGSEEGWHGTWCLEKAYGSPGNLKNTKTVFWLQSA